MNRRRMLTLPIVLLVPAAAVAAEAPDVSVYLNPN